MAVGDDREIDARSIVTLIVFIVVNFLVIYPLNIPYGLLFRHPVKFPHASQTVSLRNKSFPLNLKTAPVIGWIILAASTCIPGSVIRAGIVGSDGVKPYDIMTLFVCFAYISIALDGTGLLRYLAFTVANRSSSSGTRLYDAFYIFFALTGLIVGNDPLILSGTPFLHYFTSHAEIDPATAYLFTHFQVANLVSAFLVSSNPTNLVLTSAFGITFLQYSAWMALPTVAAVVVLYPPLRFWQFRRKNLIPPKLSPPKRDPRKELKDAKGGVFGAVLFIVTIALLIGLSAGGYLEHVLGVWVVVVPAALAMFAWNCVHDLHVRGGSAGSKHSENREMEKVTSRTGKETEESGGYAGQGGAGKADDVSNSAEKLDTSSTDRPDANAKSTPTPDQPASPIEPALDAELEHRSKETRNISPSTVSATSTLPNDPTADPSYPPQLTTGTANRDTAPPPDSSLSLFDTPYLRPIKQTFPSAIFVLSHMPWSLVPFAFSMFILVEALQYTGWIRVFGGWWTAWADVAGVAGSIWLMGTLAVIGCNLFGTNIGATILLSRVLQYWQVNSAPVSNRMLYSAVYALAVGSNFGAYSYVFSASLAGLLWRTILRQKGRTVGALEFVKWNWMPVLITMIVGCLVVAGEVCIIYKD